VSELATWEGVMKAADIDILTAQVDAGVFIGQRAGDFALGRLLEDGAQAWSSGRCFNDRLEIRWWPGDVYDTRNVLVLNELPADVGNLDKLHRRARVIIGEPSSARYLCIGQYDAHTASERHVWWENRYSLVFSYLDTAPAHAGEWGGRIYLHVMNYEFVDGHMQHRLVRFEHATQEDVIYESV